MVESLVAISVLLIGVLGPLVLATRAISDGISYKNKVTASYLAQGGLELLRSKRDININSSSVYWDNWDNDNNSNTNPCISAVGGCDIADNDSGVVITSCNVSPYCKITLDSGPTFTRSIIISSGSGGHSVKVEVTITWSEKGVSKSYSLKSSLFAQ